MSGKKPLPRLARCERKGKITVYPEKSIEDLYHLGQGNGWDTPQMVREAITKVLLDAAQDLQRPAADLPK